ncbi:MAG: phosphatase PAP2 family protein [Conexivisphaerales archaeon]
MRNFATIQMGSWIVLAYFLTLSAFFAFSGQLNEGFFFFLAGSIIALALSYQRRVVFLNEWSVFLVIAVSYEGLRYLYQPLSQRFGITDIFVLDKMLWGFNLTGTLQEAAKSSILTPVMTLAYSLHIPLVIIFAFIFWMYRRDLFRLYVTAVSICTYVAFLFFLIMPSAPPWWTGVAENLLAGGAAATYHSLSNIFESDPLAAFPSLHAAYVMLSTLILMKVGKKYGFAFVFVALAVLFSTLYLGQHFLIDLIAGTLLAFSSFFLAERLNQRIILVRGERAIR